jgi:hypothetical protein
MKTIEEIAVLADKINRIPHLNLTHYLPKSPIEEMLAEHAKFKDSDYYPYITGNKDPVIAKHMADNWHGFCIVDSCVQGRHNIDYLTTTNNFEKLTFRVDANGDPVYAPTDVGLEMPATIEYLHTVARVPQKTRISRIMPNGGNASWHSHYILALGGDPKFKMNRAERLAKKIVEPVIHIPLVTNKDVWFGITPDAPSNPEGKKYWQRYGVGEVWLFNSFFHHNVYNKGTTPRDHVMMYVSMEEDCIYDVFMAAAMDYKGPLIETEGWGKEWMR